MLLKLKICIKDQKVTGGQTVCEGLDTKPNTKSMLAFLLKPVRCHLDYLTRKAFRVLFTKITLILQNKNFTQQSPHTGIVTISTSTNIATQQD